MRVQALVCIFSTAPGTWYTPQSLLPEMKQDGTSMVRPEKTSISESNLPLVRIRYQFKPPWKPVLAYSEL